MGRLNIDGDRLTC